MGKKKANELGRALIKSRFSNPHKKKVDQNMLHTTELNDGYDWNRLNLQSVTEEDSFQDFLRTAELSSKEFQAEKLNIKFVNPKSQVGLLSTSERTVIETRIKDKKDLLKIPRRPKWTQETTPQELNTMENEAFLEWRRDLSLLQEQDGLIMTPYEKNLEFWRQLWRVVEKSDIVVQIVDARNPLLFRSEDLEKYVKEVDENKKNVLLLNKADYLTEQQRIQWAEYFDKQNITVAFFSALDKPEEECESEESSEGENPVDSDEEGAESLGKMKEKIQKIQSEVEKVEEKIEKFEIEPKTLLQKNDPEILSRIELIQFFKDIAVPLQKENAKVIGLIGYPNVGKSSTINALLQEKKVSVSSTPGKTKHFQTLFLEKDLILCDCCGLVLPSFCATKADMVLNGILPIDQLRDHVSPVNTMCTLIPRHILEDQYGILIAKPLEGEDPNRPPFSEELLLAHAYNRGFMTANGQPDQSRSARYVLKDFVNGKLLYCHSPPDIKPEDFHSFPERSREAPSVDKLPPRQQRSMKISTKTSTKDIDKVFFQTQSTAAHVQGRNNFMNFRKGAQVITSDTQSTSSDGTVYKPWKGQKREKREKLRRKYVHLDQH